MQAIESGATHYCPSPGLPSFRETIARNYSRSSASPSRPENVVVGPGAKVFEQFFCEAFLDPGDAVLVFTPHFPTYGPNLERRGAVPVSARLRQENQFRPDLNDVERVRQDTAAGQGDLPQFAPQSDRRRGHGRGPAGPRRPGARPGHRRLQR